jgi:hypothetical protein
VIGSILPELFTASHKSSKKTNTLICCLKSRTIRVLEVLPTLAKEPLLYKKEASLQRLTCHSPAVCTQHPGRAYL